MLTDVAESQGPEHGVAESVDGHVPVRVGDTALGVRDPHPAQPQLQPLAEGMHVVAVAYSEWNLNHIIKL